VVHILPVCKKFDWLYPFARLSPYQIAGTGFIFNEKGEIITCSHCVDQALSVFIRIPGLGKKLLKAVVISICPAKDIALLQLDSQSLDLIKKELGHVPSVSLGDSDNVSRGEEVVLLGYPGHAIEKDQLKSTTGVISARLNRYFQYDAATNLGNSGGPLLNKKGQVIGITTKQIMNAQNSNFAIPINIFKFLYPQMYESKILEPARLDIVTTNTTPELRTYLGIPPQLEGCLVSASVFPEINNIKEGDFIYTVNNYQVDNYGEINALYGDEKIKFHEYISQLPLGSAVTIGIYRDGKPISITIITQKGVKESISEYYPAYETIDYEIFGGMIIMPLTKNYIKEKASDIPALARYNTLLYDEGPRLIIANVFPDSLTGQSKKIVMGDTLNEVNGEKVSTLQELRNALLKSIETNYVVFKVTDEFGLTSNNILHVLSLHDSCKEAIALSKAYDYPLSETVNKLIQSM
jgi:S1-C subfamily serine protease